MHQATQSSAFNKTQTLAPHSWCSEPIEHSAGCHIKANMVSEWNNLENN